MILLSEEDFEALEQFLDTQASEEAKRLLIRLDEARRGYPEEKPA